MAKNVIRADTSRIIAGNGATAQAAGTMFKLGTDQIVVALQDIAANGTGLCLREGQVVYTKETGTAWTVGQIIYWDDSAKKLTHTATSNTRAGICPVAAASGDATGHVDLQT